MAKQWIESNHRWSHVIFTDEKRFNLDGPDSWCSWMREESSITRQKRQQGGQSVQVWGMIMPGNIFLVFLLSQRSKSSDYIKFLKNYVKPLLDTYDSDDLIFQQDNASIHVSKSTHEWIEKSGIKTMRWPSKSPDLNIIENVWSILSSMVYDGPQFDNKDALWMKIQQCAEEINI